MRSNMQSENTGKSYPVGDVIPFPNELMQRHYRGIESVNMTEFYGFNHTGCHRFPIDFAVTVASKNDCRSALIISENSTVDIESVINARCDTYGVSRANVRDDILINTVSSFAEQYKIVSELNAFDIDIDYLGVPNASLEYRKARVNPNTAQTKNGLKKKEMIQSDGDIVHNKSRFETAMENLSDEYSSECVNDVLFLQFNEMLKQLNIYSRRNSLPVVLSKGAYKTDADELRPLGGVTGSSLCGSSFIIWSEQSESFNINVNAIHSTDGIITDGLPITSETEMRGNFFADKSFNRVIYPKNHFIGVGDGVGYTNVHGRVPEI